jgi:hypothetical protein
LQTHWPDSQDNPVTQALSTRQFAPIPPRGVGQLQAGAAGHGGMVGHVGFGHSGIVGQLGYPRTVKMITTTRMITTKIKMKTVGKTERPILLFEHLILRRFFIFEKADGSPRMTLHFNLKSL